MMEGVIALGLGDLVYYQITESDINRGCGPGRMRIVREPCS